MSHMRIAGLVAMLLVNLAPSARAAALPGLFNTGVDASGVPLDTGAVDPHYRLIVSADPAFPGPSALACFPLAGGYWQANSSTSRWIAPATDENYPTLGTAHPAGTYTYRLDFDLTGYDPATARVSGTWGVDNGGSILLNGASTGISTTAYNPLVPFSLQSGFVAGVNHLDFVVENWAAGGANPTGLRVEGLAGTADATTDVSGSRAAGRPDMEAPVPNPARQSVRIGFGLPREEHVRFVVRDVAGRAVRLLVDAIRPAGRSEVRWDGLLDDGTPAPSGIYFAELASGGNVVSRRLVWMR